MTDSGSVRRRRRLHPAIATALLALVLATSALALDVPPAPTHWFNDPTGLIDASRASALDDKLRAFEQKSGAQVIIYVFDSLGGEPLEDFTMRCAEAWKVGNKKYDNGLILFVFVKDRKLRVEVGYGLEGAVTDAFSSRVIREIIAPRFKEGDYAGGLDAGADALMQKISGEEPAHEPVRSRDANGAAGGIPGGLILFFIIMALFVLPRIFMRGGGQRGCGGCFWPLLFMSGGGGTFGGGGFSGGGFGGGGFGGGGFSGGGGSFGGGGASGGW